MMSTPSDPGAATPPAPGAGPTTRPVHISNVQLIPGTGYADVVFDVTWSDSWRWSSAPQGQRRAANWDAAWIFVKYRLTASTSLPYSDSLRESLDRGESWQLFALLAQQTGELGDSPRADDSITITILERGRRWLATRERNLRGPVFDNFTITALDHRHGGEVTISTPGAWNHARITSVDAVPPGATIDLPEDRTGVFIYRNADGQGPVSFPGVRLRCAHADASMNGEVDLWIFGLEMVMVSEGAFYAGDPQGANGPLSCLYDASASGPDVTYHVQSEAEIQIGPGSESGPELYYDNQYAIANPGDQKGPLPAAFPKGFGGFYMMKHQITQGDYNDFMNTLTPAGWVNRTSYWFGSYRYTIFKTPTSQRFVLRPLRACNWLNWMDGASYAAWAGLRPMTELEYEKACRGSDPALSGEYAWGTTTIVQSHVIIGEEDGTEAISGNCNVGNMQTPFIGGDSGLGPVRDDAFAAPGKPHTAEMFPTAQRRFSLDNGYPPIPVDVRESTGTSYYGATGLSGNVWEYCVTIGDPVGRAFTGAHGDGTLNKFGNPDCTFLKWPGPDVVGTGGRGGSWYTAPSEARIADRTMGSGLQFYTTRSHDTGFRCVRTAPKRT